MLMMLLPRLLCALAASSEVGTTAGPVTATPHPVPEGCAQRAQEAAAAGALLADGDAVAAWRALPPLRRGEGCGGPQADELEAELANLLAATALRVAALSVPPAELPAEALVSAAATALQRSLRLRPRRAETHWNAALLAGMAEGAVGTWEETPPLGGVELQHSADHGSRYVAEAGEGHDPSRLTRCLHHLRRQSSAIRMVHGGLLADGGADADGVPAALWGFATAVGPAVVEAVLPHAEPEAQQMLAMILATDLPKDGDAEAAAARAHARTNAHSFSHDSSDCIALTSLAPKPVRRRCW